MLQSINARIYGGFVLMIAIIILSVGTAYLQLTNLRQELTDIKNSTTDALMTARMDIDLTTFNLVFRRFMLTNESQEDWERAQRVFGGFRTTFAEADESLTHPDVRAARETIGANAETIFAATGQIADIYTELNAIKAGPLGSDIDAMDVEIQNALEGLTAYGTVESLETAMVVNKTAHDSVKAIYRALIQPTPENANFAVGLLQQTLDQVESAHFSADLRTKLEAAITSIQDYTILTQQRDALVLANLNQLAFETGGLAEQTRIDAQAREQMIVAQAEQNIERTIAISAGILVAAVLIGILLGATIGRSIAVPIGRIKEAMLTLSKGKYDIDIPGTQRADEIGEMAQATEVFKNNLIHTKEVEEKAALQEEQQRQAMRSKQLELADAFERSMGDVVQDLSGAADNMLCLSNALQGNADDTNNRSVTMAAAAEESSTNVATVAAAVEEMSSSLTAMTTSVTDVAKRANDATAGAQDASTDLEALQRAISDIIDVVGSINEVADQTNLLALNATIEAARAGEAGKGFAVVASEVKALADQTRKMTEVITERVNSVDQTSQTAIDRTMQIVDKISHIDHAITGITDSVEQQDAATNEISHAAQEASSGSKSVSSEIQFVQKAATDMHTACAEVTQAANQIAKSTQRFQTEMLSILESVRTG